MSDLLPCPFCGSAAKAVERNNPMSKWRWSVDCASTTCGVSGPVEATKFEAVEAWNRHSAPNAAAPTGEVEEAEFVRLSDVLNLVSNWWATEDGYIAMSPFDARLHLEKHFRSAATVGNSMEALERLKAIIDWADLALKFPSEFDSHGVNLLNGPAFDAARAFLSAAAPQPNPSKVDADAVIERLTKAVEIASDQILSMYRTWIADDYTAIPPENSLPGRAYYACVAALAAEKT